MRIKKMFCLILLGVFALAGCEGALQRGMLGDAYVSTARPSITVAVKGMPVMTSGRGIANLFWSGMMGGLSIELWMAVYGSGGLAPLAIVAQAQTPQGWHWDGIMTRPFSVDQGEEVFDGVSYQACTFLIDNPAEDAFGELVTAVKPDGQPQKWMARAFAARYNFNDDKIIMEYREPLPEGVENLTALPLGYGGLLAEFAQRAREAFSVSAGPANPRGVRDNFLRGVRLQYLGEKFLGTASEDINFGNFE